MDDAKKGAFLNFKFHKVVQQRIAGEMGVFIIACFLRSLHVKEFGNIGSQPTKL